MVLENRLGCSVHTAEDGVQALELAGQHRLDLIVLDILLPFMNGLDFLRQARRQGCLENTAVVIVSALGYREIVQQASEAGARDFLVKPFDVDVLVRRLRALLPPFPRPGGEVVL
jgi:DNA-binding response OmpR family regulator